MPNDLPARIVAAFRGPEIVRPEPQELPADQDAAERLQDAIFPALAPYGAFKLGATIGAVQAALGLGRAFFGAIPLDRMFVSGDAVPAAAARQRGVESEYAFRLGRDLGPEDAGLDAAGLAQAIVSVHASLEVPGTRFEKLGIHGGLALMSDVGAVGLLVVGPGRPIADFAALDAAPVVLEIPGQEPVSGGSSVIIGGAAGPLLGFLRSALARGYRLHAGQYIATGSCTGYVEVPAGVPVTARFPALGTAVTATFTPA